MFKRLLLSLLALNLGLASAPAWAWSCAHPKMSATADMLACAKVCARSQALLTQGGKLASLSSGQCMSGKLSAGQLAKLSKAASITRSELPQASGVVAPAVAALHPGQAKLIGRAPPLSASEQVLSALPRTTSPPAFV